MEPKRKNFSANFAMDEMTSHRLSMPNFYILKIHISDKIRKRDDYFFLKEIREKKTCASYSGTNYSSFNALKDVVLRRWQNLFLHWLLNFSQLERLGIPGRGGQPRPQGFSHFLREKPWGRGWVGVGVGGLGLIFAGYVPLASQSPYPITVYSVANYRPHLSHFWANVIFAIPT